MLWGWSLMRCWYWSGVATSSAGELLRLHGPTRVAERDVHVSGVVKAPVVDECKAASAVAVRWGKPWDGSGGASLNVRRCVKVRCNT